MSAIGGVLFPNGQIGWFEYHTICPGWYSTVYDTYQKCREEWHSQSPKEECHCGDKQSIVLVQIAECEARQYGVRFTCDVRTITSSFSALLSVPISKDSLSFRSS